MAEDAAHMRDDVLGLGFLKSADFVPRAPLPMRSAATSRTNTNASFAAQLNRATLKKYSSPLHGSLPSLALPQTSLAARSKTSETTTSLGTITGSTTTGNASAARTSPSITSRPDTWPRLEPSTGSSTAQSLAAYPRPLKDHDRGLHWIPTTKQEKDSLAGLQSRGELPQGVVPTLARRFARHDSGSIG